jgi:hypothetical protein
MVIEANALLKLTIIAGQELQYQIFPVRLFELLRILLPFPSEYQVSRGFFQHLVDLDS